jgi:acyl dehydratase
MGSPGIEEIKWRKPVQAGDVLHVHAEVREARVSKSRPEMGLVFFEKQVINQDGETAMMQRSVGMFGRREKTPVLTVAPVRPPASAPPPSSPPRAEAAAQHSGPFGWFESVVLGATLALGQFQFRRDDMLRFAQTFDPQSFHLDDAAAKTGPFGALCASGWYTAAAFMQRLVATRQRLRDEAIACGENPPDYGPSPGVRNLGWLRPVYVGDTLTFTTTPVSKRLTSRPGWGLVMSRCEGTKQNGVKAFEYTAVELLPARR